MITIKAVLLFAFFTQNEEFTIHHVLVLSIIHLREPSNVLFAVVCETKCGIYS